MAIRIGQGYDIHRLVEDRPLILGGVNIPAEKGLLGHSDADVLLHALTDALFGAAALGDIGRHFPDTDPQFKGADSRVLLRECVKRVHAAGWGIVNVDASIIAQAPKLAPLMETISASVAETLGIDLGCVNIKAKTNEGMDAVGRKEAIEVHAVALLESL
ncbi:MAG: 2-C-methyl-D-erythritol 2,4-cyclodiphosphate synthase [Burkholderiaceae bacterium]|nr:2-C-methyl-D-erythritol 2,4-cyclodiphosphate synthase [Burkholderiaceae bacterium]